MTRFLAIFTSAAKFNRVSSESMKLCLLRNVLRACLSPYMRQKGVYWETLQNASSYPDNTEERKV